MTMQMVAPARTGDSGKPAHDGTIPAPEGVGEAIRRRAPGNESRRERRPARGRPARGTVRVTFGF